MTLTRTHRLAVAAMLAAAAALGGCGGDDNATSASSTPPASNAPLNNDPLPADSAPTKSEQKAAKTPDGQWAKEMCKVVQQQSDPIQPPTITNENPKADAEALSKFFGAVADQLNDQVTGLEKVGPPPADSAQEDWDAAIKKVKSVERRVSRVSQRLGKADPANQKDYQALMASVGQQMKSFMGYEGPVDQLLSNKAIKKALLGNPECREIGGSTIK